jgi:hypothetical protein
MENKPVKVGLLLRGTRPAMFDKYPGDNQSILEVKDKFYFSSQDPTHLIIPAENISSFLSAQNTTSAPKEIIGKGWQKVAAAALAFVDIDPLEIPLLRNGKQLTLDNCKWYPKFAVGKIRKGNLTIPNPKTRPVLPLPWELKLTLTLNPTPNLSLLTLKRLFVEGGKSIGLGSWRGLYGKFEVAEWVETF